MKCKHIKGSGKKCKKRATKGEYCKEHKKKDLTLKQRKWIKLYIKTGNATEAAMLVYDCKDRSVAQTIGSENISKLAFSDLMEDMGLTDVALLNVGAEGIQAKKVISARVIVKKDRPTSQADGELPIASARTDDFVEVPDYAVRHRYWETLLKLKGKLTDKPSSLTQINIGLPSWAR